MNTTIIRIIAILVIIIVLIFSSKAHKSSFICPKCGEKFKVTPSKLVSSGKASKKHKLTCPKCGKTSLMEILKEN